MKILVLGAGVVGVASAWYLAEDGHEVTVVDRQPGAGLETSRANGGQVSASYAQPWASPEALVKVLAWLGREDAPLLFRPRADLAQWMWGLRFLLECRRGRFEANCLALGALAAYSRERLRDLRARTRIQYDELSRGILHFATSERDLDALARQAIAASAVGVRRELKTAAECLALEPALQHSRERILGGVYSPDDESGDAYKFTTLLADRAAALGVRFEMGTTVSGLRRRSDAVECAVADGRELHADAYVVALGSHSPRLLRPLGVRIPVYPLKGYSITLHLRPEQAAAAPTVSLTDEACKIVISRLGDRLRAAGTAELAGYDTTVNRARVASIARRVAELFPGLGPGAEADDWAGLRPATPGNVPLIGRTALRNLFLNTGHGTLGWTLACGSARVLADLLSGRQPEVEFPFSA